MRQELVSYYKFDELPTQEAKDKALNWYREGYPDYDWWDSVYDRWDTLLEQAGFTAADIHFTGFWSKGDGACFDCSSVDIIKALGTKAEDFKLLFPMIKSGDVAASVVKTEYANHYSHANCRELVVSTPPDLTIDEHQLASRLELTLNNFRYHLCLQIYADLRAEYDYLTSDDNLTQSIIAAEYEFLADGTKV